MSKKQKNGVTGAKETLDDYISQLPDALLVQILSLLPTNDAVKSCLLSRRWRYLWHSIYNFLFVKSEGGRRRAQKFISFVDHVLTHSTCSKIKKFQLVLDYTIRWNCELEINRWITFAAERKVENVVLSSIDCHFTYVLPLSIYTCSSLRTLELSHWVFDKGLVIAWNSLKSLKLEQIGLDSDGIVNLLSGCPALETLELKLFFGGFRRVEITSPNLKRLTLAGHMRPHCHGNEESLEIIAPHIQHLEISGDLGHLQCRLVNVSSLVTASLTFQITCITEFQDEDDVEEDSCLDYHQVSGNLVLDYLQKLSCVTELSIGSWLAEVVFMLQLEGVPLPELRCKCLTLEMNVTNYNLYGVASLLWTSPLLETLNIHLGAGVSLTDYHCELELSYFNKGDNSNLQNWISNIVFSNLNNVKIIGCTGMCWNDWCEHKLFELSEFLLKNAVVLKKFVIIAKDWICLESCVSQYLSQYAKELLDSPRSSKNLVITYEECD